MIVITGGAGFIGSNLVHYLNSYFVKNILIFDTLVSSQSNKIANLKGAEYEYLTNPEFMLDWLNKKRNFIEAVVHLAAITDTRRHDAELFATNYCLSIDLFNWCTACKVPFIYASSAATYGAGDYGFKDDHAGLKWLVPQTMYGWSKHVFDRWVLEHGRTRDDHPPLCVGLKFFNVYGPRENHKHHMASIVSQRLDDVRGGRPVRLFKSHRQGILDGEQKRDFIHVDDVCSVIKHFLDLPGSDFGIYNVGTGYARSFRDVVVAMGVACGKTVEIEYVDMPLDVRTCYQYHTEADINKLRRSGYEMPFLSLEEGVRRTVNAYETMKQAA